MLFLLAAGTACEDSELEDCTQNVSSHSTEYWYTRSLTRAQLLELRRNHGLGFSYDAVYGGKCDMAAVRCQVLNVSAFDEAGLAYINTATKIKERTEIAHSFSEYCQATNLSCNISGDVLIYTADYSKVASIYEHGMDTVTCFYNTMDLQSHECRLDTTDIAETIKETPEKFLTPSFLYGIEKVKNAKASDVVVVDSFIDIFGTHVVIDAKVGAKLTLDVKSRRSNINDYKSEEIITSQKLNLLFYKKDNTLTDTEQEFLHQVLDNSNITLSVKGGNTALFNGLIAQPTYNNPDANETTLNEWTKSIRYDDVNYEKNNVELIDMEVIPIWEFIPDENVAKRVMVRIISSAPTMQEIFGNRNWVNTRFGIDVNQVQAWVANKEMVTYKNPWVCNIVASNRYVATLCREWVPEIDENNTVTVAYPIYENKVDIGAGLCIHQNKAYNVAWRYDRFVVKEIENAQTDGNFYLAFGCLSLNPISGVNYQPGHLVPGYEWPGSINVVNGNISGELLLTRKFLGNFYLENSGKYNNLPNWFYVVQPVKNDYYQNMLKDYTPYRLSGIGIGKQGTANTANRMVRSDNYTYYINKNEAWYEK